MNIHEYQAKKILSQYGISIPKGMIAYTPHEAKKAAAQVSFRGPWMLKAQIQSGARNKGYFTDKKAGRRGNARLAQEVLRNGQMAGTGDGQELRQALDQAQQDG